VLVARKRRRWRRRIGTAVAIAAPALSIFTLVSALLLLIAPARVKQFSSHQWQDELKRPLLEYWPYAWRFQYVRIICAACYAVGGALAVWIIGNKLVTVFIYIIRNSTFSWFPNFAKKFFAGLAH
jgi:hypothetical protein